MVTLCERPVMPSMRVFIQLNPVGERHYSFVTCNLGEGVNYHLSTPTCNKIRYQGSIRINDIPAARMQDKVRTEDGRVVDRWKCRKVKRKRGNRKAKRLIKCQ